MSVSGLLGVEGLDPRIATRVRVDANGCWLWMSSINAYGYASIRYPRTRTVHRITYEQLVGPIPEGLEIDHLCRVRHCVNPAHMEPVTHRVNTLRSDNPAAINARKTHCHAGHEFTPDNTYGRNGHRQCRACNAAAQRRYQQRRRESS